MGGRTDKEGMSRPTRWTAAALVVALVLGAASVAGAQGGGADLAMKMTAPDAPGVGSTFEYRITVTNKGPGRAEAVTLTDALPAEVDHVSTSWDQAKGSCSYVSEEYPPPEPKPAGGAAPGEPQAGGRAEPGGASTAPEYYRYHQVECQFPSLAAGETTSVTVTATRRSAWPLYNGAWVTSETGDPNWENDYAETYIDADPSATADLSLAMTAPASVAAGAPFDYIFDVGNIGPARATDVVVNDFLPDGLEYVSATSSDATDDCTFNPYEPPSIASQGPTDSPYYGLTCELGALAVGERTRIVISVNRTSAREIYNSAWISGSSYDPNYENDYSEHILDADKSNPADLSVAKSTTDAAPGVGTSFAYKITVKNNGPAAARGVSVSDYLPYEVDYETVNSTDSTDECSFEDYGYFAEAQGQPNSPARRFGQINCDLGTLASGETATITITVTRASGWPIYNSAWVTSSSYDPNYENDYAQADIDADPNATADVGILKSAPEAPGPGEQFDYTLVVTNNGPARADAVVINDYLPDGVEYVSSATSDPGDNCSYEASPGPEPLRPEGDGGIEPAYYGFYCELGEMNLGEKATITLTVRRIGEQALYNSAWVSTTSYDPNYDNNYSAVCTEGDSPPPPEARPAQDDINSGGGKVETGPGDDRINVTACGDSGGVVIESGRGGDSVDVAVNAAENFKNVRVNGGPGADRIAISIGPEAVDVVVVIAAGDGNDEITIAASPGSGVLRIVLKGGSGADVLTGGALSEVLRGGRGSDLLIGSGGDDRLIGGHGDDTCRPGPGNNKTRC